MELISIGFLLGVVFSLIIAGSGTLYGSKVDKRQHDDDSDMRIYVPGRNRRGSSCNRFIEQMDDEEIASVLECMRIMSITKDEKQYLTEAAKRLRKE